jgi:hypothetical protein
MKGDEGREEVASDCWRAAYLGADTGDVDIRRYAAVRPCMALGEEANGRAEGNLARAEKTLLVSNRMLAGVY